MIVVLYFVYDHLPKFSNRATDRQHALVCSIKPRGVETILRTAAWAKEGGGKRKLFCHCSIFSRYLTYFYTRNNMGKNPRYGYTGQKQPRKSAPRTEARLTRSYTTKTFASAFPSFSTTCSLARWRSCSILQQANRRSQPTRRQHQQRCLQQPKIQTVCPRISSRTR